MLLRVSKVETKETLSLPVTEVRSKEELSWSCPEKEVRGGERSQCFESNELA